jgi:hypothetical protein
VNVKLSKPSRAARGAGQNGPGVATSKAAGDSLGGLSVRPEASWPLLARLKMGVSMVRQRPEPLDLYKECSERFSDWLRSGRQGNRSGPGGRWPIRPGFVRFTARAV